jgi:excisionase family DNA binding protein
VRPNRGVTVGGDLRPDRPTRVLLTVREAAAVLTVSPQTVWKMVWTGELPSVRFRRSVRIRTVALAALIRRARSAARPGAQATT